MRVHLKGGVWKNTEDEILKAAVMKYGKTQWARISSLLVRKTPKQCKARWYEWLDPSIKKTEWSKEEDEKLLHLAKLMPTQWRTIAPIVGRAPAQCLERYQRLLDEAEARAAGDEDEFGLRGETSVEGQAAGASDVRKTRPGDINFNPESKPARPDPVDMDEDEKDMLSEARARLANTQGKKAKRKARERQLEEARRLATLQKRRELKAAGVELKPKKPKKNKAHIDYNIEIPYEKKPMPGFYDTTEELARKGTGAESLKGKFLDNLEAKSRLDREEESRREAKRKRDNKDKNAVAFVRASDQKAAEAIAAREEAEQHAKRKKLVLPAPQVDDTELETISKLGQQGALARELVGTDVGGSTDTLLGDYSETPSMTAARTPRTPAQANRIMNEALAQRALAAQSTPLLGGDGNQPSLPSGQGTGFHGAMPHGGDMATPNPLVTPFRSTTSTNSVTGASKLPPTVRDELRLNTPVQDIGSTPHDRKMASRSLREQLARKLALLPKPKNEFEIIVPETASSINNEASVAADGVAALNIDSSPKRDAGTSAIIEDQGDIERRAEQQRKQESELEFSRRSKCVQRDLPRPNLLNTNTLAVSSFLDEQVDISQVLSLIGSEMKALILHDARKYPEPNAPPLRSPDASNIQLEEIPDSLLAEARALIENEMASMQQDVRDVYTRLAEPSNNELWHRIEDNYVWLPQERAYYPADKLSMENRIEGYKADFTRRREIVVEGAERAIKLERKLEVTLGGYQARAKMLGDKIAAAFKDFEQARIDTQAFSMLYAMEQAIIPSRIEKAEDGLRKVEARESQLQSEYRELLERRNELAAELASRTAAN
ncbi:pre-mRNA splicing factor component-domain-containing protein [Coemansia spiralis]|nr:pre-mRNA splicing factor component-domain-containing protein [Coemansia spiralis]